MPSTRRHASSRPGSCGNSSTETQADLGVIVSAYIYDNVIRQHDGQPRAATPYRKIRFRVKESALTAWIHLTGAASE